MEGDLKKSVRMISFFLFSFYFLQLYGLLTDVRIKDVDIQIIAGGLVLFQILCVLLYYLFVRKDLSYQSGLFFKTKKITIIFLFIFITVELAAVILFLKEGIPIFDADPGGAKLRIADGNGIYIRYIKYFGNIVCFTLCLLLKDRKILHYSVVIIYFSTISLFGYRSELIMLMIQYYILMSVINNDTVKSSMLRKLVILFSITCVVSGLFYFSLGQEGQENNNVKNIDRIFNRLTIEQVESVPYIINESMKYDLFPTSEIGKEINAIANRFQGIKDNSLFYGERLHKDIFGDMGENFLSVTTFGAELLAFFGPFCLFLIPLGIYIPYFLLIKMSQTKNTVLCSAYSYSVVILLQYLIAGNFSAFVFGPIFTIVIMCIPLVLLHDVLKRLN